MPAGTRGGPTSPGAPPSQAAIPQVPDPGYIAALEQVVARDPKNLKAWIELGDRYFDSHQPARAVDAYAQALAIDPTNPNVITDQGVMYRELRQFDKALANFERASKLDPKHSQSVFNMGVVYSADLGQTEKAIQAWNRVIEMDPASPQAAQARSHLAELKGRPGAR
jgi:cytochrome c-type biogenesis protein CcmH/NrfG